jgi:succinoglycan biosynthesis transport protein ExoP
MPPGRHGDRSLRGHLETLRRRRGVVLLAMVVVPAAALATAASQTPEYEASARVVLGQGSIPGSLQTSSDLPDRVLHTEAGLAHTPAVARRVVGAMETANLTTRSLLAHTTVAGHPQADLLTFNVRDSDAGLARRLAREYARQYAAYRQQRDRAPVQRALAGLDRGEGGTPGGVARTARELQTQQALGVAGASYVPTAESTKKIRPRMVRTGVFGLLFGTLFGIGLAFLWHAFDTRLRSSREVSDGLGLSLLARVPANRRLFEPDSRPVMLSAPESTEAEAFRFLRANFEAANRERRAQSLMVTSARGGEGKSSVAANLALALTSGGRRVTLVDLGLRNPMLARSFGLRDAAGVTDVALGAATLADALVTLSTPTGVLRMLTAGPPPPDPAEFHTTKALASILHELRASCDLMIIDSSSLLDGGDASTLGRKVDAMLLVTRWTVLRGPELPELRRALDRCPAAKLGFVLTEAELGAAHDRLAKRVPART